MSSDEINTMLDNLSQIKAGNDLRQNSKPVPESNDALEVAKAEVERLFNKYPELSTNLRRDELHVVVARWDGRNGYCKYNSRVSKHRFNKRLTGTEYASGHFIIGINEKILEGGNREGFIDTVRHEVAHALAYTIHGSSQKHNGNWRAVAKLLGAKPSSCNGKRDRSDEYDYYIYCPNPDCDMKSGKTKRSKVIKQPFNRKCIRCGHSPLSSCDADGDFRNEEGVVDVESLSWDNKDEWFEAGCP